MGRANMLAVGAVLAVGLFGCGGAPFEPKAECAVEGFGTVHFEDAKDQDCEMVQAVFPLAKQTLLEDGLATEEELATLSGVEVWIEKDRADGKFLTSGHYSKFVGITLSNDYLSLAHEIAHHLQVLRAVEVSTSLSERVDEVGTASHKGWDTNGFNLATDHYQDHVYAYLKMLVEEGRYHAKK